MLIYDKVQVTSREATPEGYLRVTARLSRIGIQEYLGSELGVMGDGSSKKYKMWRPDDEVFSKDSLRSFAMKPVTDEHPPELLHPGNFKTYAVGYSGENVQRDEDYVRISLMLTEPSAIAKIAEGKRELSAGYELDIDWTSGKTPDGESYDGVQRNIRGNHIALVDAGRCGGECRLDDKAHAYLQDCGCASCQLKGKAMTGTTDKPPVKTVQVDGLAVELSEQAASVLDRVVKERDEARSAERRASKNMFDRDADLQKQLRDREDEINKLKAGNSPQAIAEACDQRLDIITRAMEYLPDEYETKGKTDIQICKDAVTATLGPDNVSGKSDEYIRAMFDALDVQPNNGVSLGKAITTKMRGYDREDNGQGDYQKRLTDAWKTAGRQPVAAE